MEVENKDKNKVEIDLDPHFEPLKDKKDTKKNIQGKNGEENEDKNKKLSKINLKNLIIFIGLGISMILGGGTVGRILDKDKKDTKKNIQGKNIIKTDISSEDLEILKLQNSIIGDMHRKILGLNSLFTEVFKNIHNCEKYNNENKIEELSKFYKNIFEIYERIGSINNIVIKFMETNYEKRRIIDFVKLSENINKINNNINKLSNLLNNYQNYSFLKKNTENVELQDFSGNRFFKKKEIIVIDYKIIEDAKIDIYKKTSEINKLINEIIEIIQEMDK